jgi:hypothetical protein
MEVSEMNNDNSVNDVESEPTSNTPPIATSDRPADVVKRELEDSDSDLDGEDQATTKTQEQEAEELRRKIAEIERKVADGN